MEIRVIKLLLVLFFVLPAVASAATVNKPPNNLGLVGYWSMDEGTSTIAHDGSSNGSTGTLTGTPAWATGKHGKAISIVNSNSYVNVASLPPIGTTATTTISAWVYSNANQSSYAGIFETRGTSNGQVGLIFSGGGTNTITFQWLANEFNINTGVTVPNGQWTLITVVSTSTGWTLYKNGVSTFSQAQTNNTQNLTGAWDIGNDHIGHDRPFNGKLDDVRIYSRALTAAQVAALYQQGEARVNASGVTLNNGTTLGNGLVGYWTFDGGVTNWNIGKTYDSSGQNNTGQLVALGTTTSTVVGKLGQAFNFNGTSQYVQAANSSSLTSSVWTVSAWIKPPNQNQFGTIVAKRDLTTSGQFQLFIDDGTGNGVVGKYFACYTVKAAVFGRLYRTNTTIVDGKWHHVACSYSTSADTMKLYVDGILQSVTAVSVTGSATNFTDSNPVTIGYNGIGSAPNYFTGPIDDVRVYNRVLTATEVKQLYNLASSTTNASSQTLQNGTSLASGLVGLWTFDGKNINWRTNTVSDLSGNGNDATSTALSTTTSPTSGKSGQALKFDGASQYLSVPNQASFNVYPMTASAWVKTSQSAQYPSIVDKSNGSFNGWKVFMSNGLFCFSLTSGGAHIGNGTTCNGAGGIQSSTTYNDNKWHLVSVTVDGSGAKMYVDGVQNATQAWTGGGIGASISSQPVSIGRNPNPYYFAGSIDDVRVYNKALSAAEIKSLYNLGK